MTYNNWPLWRWPGSEITFKPQFSVHPPKVGKEPVSSFSPIWTYSLKMPPVDPEQREEIEAEIYAGRGVQPIRMWDHRKPVPKHWRGKYEANIPELKVLGVRASNSTIDLRGSLGDRIYKGDPIAFSHGYKRHYYVANEDLVLTGAKQTLSVRLRPRESTITNVTVERIRPTLAFIVDYNTIQGSTELSGFTDFSVEGFEYLGDIV